MDQTGRMVAAEMDGGRPIVSFEALEQLMSRQRAVRLFDISREVGDDLVEGLLRCAVAAPNGGNRQPWRFIVVRDRAVKAALGAVFDGLGETLYGGRVPEHTAWADVPLLIAVCFERLDRAPSAETSPPGASTYPAVQNLLLAANALGLGGVLTTRWHAREPEIGDILGLPPAFEVHAILPLGWPARRYGRNRRAPIGEVTYRDRFGEGW